MTTKKTQVTAKKGLTGFVLGVQFTNGRGETDSPTALSFFRQSDDFDIDGEKPKPKAASASTDT